MMTVSEFKEKKSVAIWIHPGDVFRPEPWPAGGTFQDGTTFWLYNIDQDVLVQLVWSVELRRFVDVFYRNPENPL